MPRFDYTHDLFISYAHADDESVAQQTPWIQELVDTIRERHHAEFSPHPLDVFFDKQAIRTMDAWDLRIKESLRGSRVMLAILSPAYFASEYCRQEWKLYLDRELDRGLPGKAIAPLYIIEVPGFEDKAKVDRWMTDMGSRQFVDIRPWWNHGPAALRLAEVQVRMHKLDEDIAEAVELSDRVADSPTNIPEHNRYFCGREAELKSIRDILVTGQSGQTCIVQGLGGMGKSALTFEYAHAFGFEYQGGRYLVNATGHDDLRTVLLQLSEPLGIGATGQSGGDDDIQVRKICERLRQGPPRLVIVDNIENSELLARSVVSELLPIGDMLHVIATTRLSAESFIDANVIVLDTLDDDDCVSLLEKYRTASGPEDKAAQHRIAAICGGYPLVTETAAVFLWQNPDVSYAGFAQRLNELGIGTINEVGAEDGVRLSRHAEAMVSKVLEPTLNSLNDVDRIVLEYATALPAESVPWAWLRALVARHEPTVAKEPEPGFPDPWKRIQRRLLGLRLLSGTTDSPAARIHRVVQAVVRASMDEDTFVKRDSEVEKLALERSRILNVDWYLEEVEWEIDAFFPLCIHALETGKIVRSAMLAVEMAQAWLWADRLTAAGRMYLRIKDSIEATSDFDPVLVARVEASLSCTLRDWLPKKAYSYAKSAVERIQGRSDVDSAVLANIYQEYALADYEAGTKGNKRELLRKAEGYARAAGERGALHLVAILNNLGFSHVWQNDAKMKNICEEALAIAKKYFSDDHPAVAICMANIGWAEANLGNYDRARDLITGALEIDRKSLDPDHMHVNFHLSNLATVESAYGNHESALAAAKEALAIDQRRGVGPLDIAMSFVKLAECEQNAGHHEAAIGHFLEVIAIRDDVEGYSQKGNPDILTRIAYNYEMLSRTLEATTWYLRARELGGKIEGLNVANTLGANWFVYRTLGSWRTSLKGNGAIESDSPEVFLSCGPADFDKCNELVQLMRPLLSPHGVTVACSDPRHRFDGSLEEQMACNKFLINTRATVVFASPDYFKEDGCHAELQTLFWRAVAEWTARQGEDPATVPSWLTPAFFFSDAYDLAPGAVHSSRQFAGMLLHDNLLGDTFEDFEDFEELLTRPRWTLEAAGASTEDIAPVLSNMLLLELIGKDAADSPPTASELWSTIIGLHSDLPGIDIGRLTEQLQARDLDLDKDTENKINEESMYYQEWVVLLRAIVGGFATTWAFHRDEALRPTSQMAQILLSQNETLMAARKSGMPLGNLVNVAINYRIVEDIQRGYYCYAARFGRSVELEIVVIAACCISLEMFDGPIGDEESIVRQFIEPLLDGTPIEYGF